MESPPTLEDDDELNSHADVLPDPRLALVIERRKATRAHYQELRDQKAQEATLERARLRLAYLEAMAYRRQQERAAMSEGARKREKLLRARAANSSRSALPQRASQRYRKKKTRSLSAVAKWKGLAAAEKWTRVAVRIKGGGEEIGWLRYVGPLHCPTKCPVWIGIEASRYSLSLSLSLSSDLLSHARSRLSSLSCRVPLLPHALSSTTLSGSTTVH